MKRRLKEFFRLNSGLLDSNYDLWIVMKNKFTKNDSKQIENDFKDILVNINYKK